MATRFLTRLRPTPRTRSDRPIVTGDEPLLDQELMTSLQRLALSAPRVQRGKSRTNCPAPISASRFASDSLVSSATIGA